METQHLDLSGNSISFLPNRSFTQTPIMRTLDLSNNGLTKMAIDAFAALGDLESLNLSHNNLDGKFLLLLCTPTMLAPL